MFMASNGFYHNRMVNLRGWLTISLRRLVVNGGQQRRIMFHGNFHGLCWECPLGITAGSEIPKRNGNGKIIERNGWDFPATFESCRLTNMGI